MRVIWSHDGIWIPEPATVRWVITDCWIIGTAVAGASHLIEWRAKALSGGWYIEIVRLLGKSGEYQGATFNLPLEVATAIKRLI